MKHAYFTVSRLGLNLLCASILGFSGAAAVLAADGVIPLDGIVAVVNDDIITITELGAEVQRISQELRRRNTQAPAPDILQKQVLERLVNRRIQLQTAKRANIVVDDKMLNLALTNIASESNLTLSQFRQVLVRDGVSFEQFRENIRDEITLNRFYQRQIDSRVSITEADITAFLETQQAQGNISVEYQLGHILIAIPEDAAAEEVKASRKKAEDIVSRLQGGADFAETAVAESDGSTALDGGNLGWRGANELPTLFTPIVPGMNKGDTSKVIKSTSGFHIVKLLDTRDTDTQIVKQTQARHILVANKDRNKEEALALAQELHQRIEDGEDFASLAKEHSDDLGSGKEGGSLGWVSPGATVAPFENAMNALAPGEMSDPIESRFGWHIIHVDERRDFDATETVKQKRARDIVRQRRIEEERQTELRRLRDDAYVELRL
ncbi:MAG: molecular chaperone SurA [Gammaproteobacteria bacterium]|nr:MAG: molecular chaperone SurA [Gammaproteobacteria bacterium]